MYGPACDDDRAAAAIEQLDEIIREGRAGIAAAPVDLADDDRPGGTGGTPTSSVMLPPLLRICASATVNGNIFNPLVVLLSTVAWKEKMLSPAISSPFVALSKNGCAANPPMDVRLPVTVIPVLVGFAPGVTVTVAASCRPV